MSTQPSSRLSAAAYRALPPVVIQPARGWPRVAVAELWVHRELLWVLARRDLQLRYRQTLMGALWVVLQPLLIMLVLTAFFSKVLRGGGQDIPYSIFVLSGLVSWNYFTSSLTLSSRSVVADAGFVRKVYFPRLLIPVAPALAGMVDLVVAMGIIAVMMAIAGQAPHLGLITLPFWILLLLVITVGCGFWFSALSVRYRDILYMIPFILQLGFFVTPIMYSPDILPAPWSELHAINPMAAVVQGFRWAITGTAESPGAAVVPATVFAIVFLVTGALFFRRCERDFADLL